MEALQLKSAASYAWKRTGGGWSIALYGTAQIAREKHEILREHFSEGFYGRQRI